MTAPGAFLVRLGVVLAVGEPVEKFIGVEVEMRRDLRELVEARAVVRLEHVDEVGDEVFVEHQAVAEHLEGVLARVGIGGRLVRLPGGSGGSSGCGAPPSAMRAKSARAKSSSWKPSNRPSAARRPLRGRSGARSPAR